MTTGEPSKITNNPETGWAVASNTGIPNNATYNKTVVTGNGKYASANYTLTITVQVYQANKQAVAGTAFETVVPETYTFSFAYNLTIKHVNRPKFMCFFCARKSILSRAGKV